MTRLARIVLTAVAILTLTSDAAWALDRAIFGQKMIVKRSSSGKEKLIVFLKDQSLLFPAIGGADDPSSAGMLIELFPGNGGSTASFLMPTGLGKPGWTTKDANFDSYKFVNRDAPDGISEIRVALLRQGKLLKIVAKRTGLDLATPQQSVGVRITTGSLRNCALFTGLTIQRDEPGLFKARKAPPPLGCDTETLLQLPPACGDGIVNGSEECDGPGTCTNPVPGIYECTAVGAPDECTCCSDNCPAQTGGCCQPSIIIPEAGSCGGTCISTTCAPPFNCSGNAQCLPDESCCSPAGEGCFIATIMLPITPCCPGTVCGAPFAGGLAFNCCHPGAGPCTSDADCCSDACGVDGTCDPCSENGTACTGDIECCSRNCGASGTCECGGTGTRCFSSSHCCSGSCNPNTLACDP